MTEVETRERPILFSAEMVRAVLDGTKTQTRRVIKEFDSGINFVRQITDPADADLKNEDDRLLFEGRTRESLQGWDRVARVRCPYGAAGDQLYVKEGYQIADVTERGAIQYFTTADDKLLFSQLDPEELEKWRKRKYPFRGSPGRFMYRSLSRIQLEITDVRVERVQEITEEDALADGGWTYGTCPFHKAPEKSFRHLWDEINGHREGCSWNDDPFVWIIEFRRLRP